LRPLAYSSCLYSIWSSPVSISYFMTDRQHYCSISYAQNHGNSVKMTDQIMSTETTTSAHRDRGEAAPPELFAYRFLLLPVNIFQVAPPSLFSSSSSISVPASASGASPTVTSHPQLSNNEVCASHFTLKRRVSILQCGCVWSI
jgi:hypothetical protein